MYVTKVINDKSIEIQSKAQRGRRNGSSGKVDRSCIKKLPLFKLVQGSYTADAQADGTRVARGELGGKCRESLTSRGFTPKHSTTVLCKMHPAMSQTIP